MELKKSVWTFAIISVCIYVILIVLGDINSIKNNIQKFSWKYLIFAIGFFLLAILIRIIRWNFWFHKIDPSVSRRASTLFYLSGLAFSITPGRVGEAIRSYFIKRDHGTTQSKTVPLVLVERFYDLIGLLVVLGITLIFVDFNKTIMIIPITLVSVFFVLTQKKSVMKKILLKVSKIKFLSRFAPNAEESADTLYQMFHFKNFIPSTLLGSLLVFIDILGAYMIILGLLIGLDLAKSTLIISVSVIAGALSFIPGGLGVQEGGLLGLMTIDGVEYSKALVFVILYRITSTLVMTVIGVVTFRKISRKIKSDEI
jgi:glycosyltransferase 2 family protein